MTLTCQNENHPDISIQSTANTRDPQPFHPRLSLSGSFWVVKYAITQRGPSLMDVLKPPGLRGTG